MTHKINLDLVEVITRTLRDGFKDVPGDYASGYRRACESCERVIKEVAEFGAKIDAKLEGLVS